MARIIQKQSTDLKAGDCIDVWWSRNSIPYEDKWFRPIREIKPYTGRYDFIIGILVFEPDGKEMSLEKHIVFDVLVFD